MSASDSRPVPRKNVAYRYYFAMRKNNGSLQTGWAGADSEVSKDGGSFTDCSNEATEIGSSGCGYIDLTASEMDADAVVYKLTLSNNGALPLVVTFFPEEVGDYRADVVQISGDTTAADNLESYTDGTTPIPSNARHDITGSVVSDGSNSATTFKTDRTESTNDYWKDTLIRLTSGTLSGQVKKVTAYNGSTKFITVSGGFTGTPAAGVTFDLVNE